MEFGYLLGGGAPTIKKYKMAAGHAAGIVVLVAAANATGLSTSTTTSFAKTVGLTMDAGVSQGSPLTYSTVQGNPEYLQTVIVNPDAVFKAFLAGSAAGAALEERTVGTVSSNGLTVVGTSGDSDPSSPDMDEGTVWYTTGGNASQSRKITSTTTPLTVTVIMPFFNANKVGDKYLTIPYTVGTKGACITMTTDLQRVRGDLAITGATAAVLDYDLLGKTNSALHLVLTDHIFGMNT
jgi:hypothetical protein